MASRSPAAPDELAVGVDAGGTWVRLVALRGERQLLRSRLRAEPDLPRLLRRMWRELGWRRVGHLVVAARGVWSPAERRGLAARLRGLAGEARAISDVEAAHRGALGGEPGILVLAGTGSIVLGRGARGGWVRQGGLGPLLGDDGSAFWIGREWLRTRSPSRARVLSRGPEAVARIAALARGVLARAARGARLERAIVRSAQAQLASQALHVALALGAGARDEVQLSWAGALMAQPAFRRGVARALAVHQRARWRAPREDPALAAARLAGRRG